MAADLRRKFAIFLAESVGEITGVRISISEAARAANFKGSEFQLSMKTANKHVINNVFEKCRTFPGFGQTCQNEDIVHVSVNQKWLVNGVIKEVLTNPTSYWRRSPLLDEMLSMQTAVVEYSSPNIAKPFHAGHLRSTILGTFVSNIHEAFGYRVVRVNYLGDWGAQVGKLLEGFAKFGNAGTLRSLKDMMEVYVKASNTADSDDDFKARTKSRFQSLENSLYVGGDGSTDDMQIWNEFRHVTIRELGAMYKRLGVHFDCIDAESMYAQSGRQLAESMVTTGKAIRTSDGAIVTSFATNPGDSTEKITRTVPLVTSAGATLYLLRDLAAALDRMARFNFGKLLYVTEDGQKDHFASLLRIAEQQLNINWASCVRHVTFGRIHGMSTRRGNVVLLADILDEAKEHAMKAMEQSPNTRTTNLMSTADALGVASVIINDFRCKRNQNYAFSWERAVRTKGDTGIFLQYAHSRLCNLECNVGTMDISHEELLNRCSKDVEKLSESSEALTVIQCIASADQSFDRAFQDLEPSVLVHHLFKLVNCTNVALARLRVKGHTEETSRVALFRCARIALANGLRVLGIEPLKNI